ncbi:KilA-N domain-containing protein [Aeromonas enteropelogenes]|uniref:KilA-N domain-containing protein n=1 Tax=Aeromonas enteropelogenes TaxID=29489 RepID=UPI0022864451|nr:phage antirepressor KilAC domain-containing protein [Aeromonas enteropelogenes]MCZ0752595.1 phage antirepressor KilAC domain-containing protein [Aeromonas enteropelogenes]
MTIQQQYQQTKVLAGPQNSMPVIAGVEITTDEAGRFNLNSLHRASGLGASKAPAQWLRTKQAQELVAEVEKQTMQICIVSVEGRNGGTFAHELLAISYAGWISPAFQLQVNQAFLDYRTGKLAPVPQQLTTIEILQIAMQSEQERLRLLTVNQELEQKIETDAPLVRFTKQVEVTPDSISVGKAAKIIGTGQNRLFAYLRQIGWVSRKNEPYQAKIEQGLMDVKISPWEHPEFGLQKRSVALVTGKGLSKLQQLWAVDQGRLLS